MTLAKRRTALLVAVAALVLTLAVSACSADENDMFTRVNATRAQVGTGQLNPDIPLIVKAQALSKQLASGQQLHHSALTDGAPTGWRRLAENVGTGPSTAVVNQAFLDSPTHRANIVDPGFTHLGVGVTIDANGQYWVVEEFAAF